MELSFHGPIPLMALLMLFPLSMVLFGTMKPAKAMALIAFGAVLYGPEGAYYKFPLFPHLTKENLPYIFGGLAAVMFAGPKFFRKMPGLGPELILFLAVFTAIITARQNQEPLTYGGWMTITLPGMDFKDAMAMGLEDVMKMAVPFMVARAIFEDRDDLRMLLKAFVGMLMVYSLWIFIELKMSPQMNIWVYGYFAHSEFSQVYRWGGYRPMVFMGHGLALSLLVCHACLILAACKRAGVELFDKYKTKHLLWFMLVLLVLCKSSGSIFYALILVPLLLRSSIGTTSRVAQILAALVILYPFLRSQDLVPVDSLINAATNLSKERAASLAFRFENEGQLLVKAQEKLWFGWGSYGRNSIYESEMGRETVIADGAWIIFLGMRGFVGLFLEMGIPVLSVLYAGRKLKKIPHEEDRWMMLGLMCVLGLGLFDLIPNGLFNHYPYFIAGALYGLAQGLTSPKALRAARGTGGHPIDSGKRKKKKKRKKGQPLHPPGVYIPQPPPPGTPTAWSTLDPPSVAAQDRLFEQERAAPHVEDALFEDQVEPGPDDAPTIILSGHRRGPGNGDKSE